MLKIFSVLATVTFLAGCASTEAPSASNRSEAKNAEVRTGTRLPARNTDGVKVTTGEDYKQDANRTVGTAPRGN